MNWTFANPDAIAPATTLEEVQASAALLHPPLSVTIVRNGMLRPLDAFEIRYGFFSVTILVGVRRARQLRRYFARKGSRGRRSSRPVAAF